MLPVAADNGKVKVIVQGLLIKINFVVLTLN